MKQTAIKKLLFLFLVHFLFIQVQASDIVHVSALNNRIILIRFDDGYVRYHRKGESRQNEWVVADPLDAGKAEQLENYTIRCADGFYSTPLNPQKIERKSKGTEFSWLCTSWSQTQGCVNPPATDHTKEHWIYLHLPEPLEAGKTYSVSTKNLAGNGSLWEFTFDITKNRSEAIHVNLVGYDPRATKKYGYVYHWSGSGGSVAFNAFEGDNFYLINTNTKEKVFTGSLRFRKSKTNKETYQSDTPNGNYLGADVYECDFSDFNTPGEYILAVEGVGCSFPFKIGRDIYRLPFYTAIRGLYHNRSGIALEKPFTEFTRGAPHNPTLTPGFAGRLKYTSSRFVDWKEENNDPADKQTIENGILGPINTWGWYQDAGDWDGYFSHMKIPVMLMLTWEIAPEKFADGELNLPEGLNNLPDILDEARWLIRFFHRTRHEIMNKGYGTGGIGSRVAPDWFGHAEEGTPSYLDTGQWIVSGEDPFTTFFYSGLAAHYQLILNKLNVADPDSVDWTTEAEQAYEWAVNNVKSGDLISSNVHGLKIGEYKLYAATVLFRLTGDEKYLNAIKELSAGIGSATIMDEDQKWGPYSLITGKERIFPDESLMNRLKGAIIATADKKYESISMRACRYGGNNWLPMVIGQGTTPRVFEMMMGHYLSKEFAQAKTASYQAGLFTTADYFLGCNPLNMAWITHVGVRYPERILHLDSWYSETGEMIPGVTPYGPWRNEPQNGPIGPWSIQWPNKTLFPEDINEWPGHERWFNNYTTPPNAEFTVHQNTVLSAVVYGYLCDEPDGSFNPNDKPSVSITSPLTNDTVKGSLILKVEVDDPDGREDIAWVEFYNDWHKIGQSNEAPYSFTWKQPVYGAAHISAKVVDKRGFSATSDTVYVEIKPADYNVTIEVLDSLSAIPVQNCTVGIGEKQVQTDSLGKATFEQVSGVLTINLQKKGYLSKSIAQLSIYSDTTLTFFLTPSKNEITFIVLDELSGEICQWADVTFNNQWKQTNENGEVSYLAYKGEYSYNIDKASFESVSGTINLVSDTVLYILMIRTEAEIKFVLKEETTPINNALIVLNSDKLITGATGIARFRNLPVSTLYSYLINKEGYRTLADSLFLTTDTTINISMLKIPVGNRSILKNDLEIWPIPSSGKIFLKAGKIISHVEIATLTGTTVKSYLKIMDKSLTINFPEHLIGYYFIKIYYSNGLTDVRKIVVN